MEWNYEGSRPPIHAGNYAELEPLLGLGRGRMGIRKRIYRDYPQAYNRIMEMLVTQNYTLEEIQNARSQEIDRLVTG